MTDDVIGLAPEEPRQREGGGSTFTPMKSLRGKRVGMVVFSSYPADPRPRRAAEALLREGVLLDLICEAGDKLPKEERFGNSRITRIPIKHHRGGKLSYAYQYLTFIIISGSVLAWRSLRHKYDLIYVHNMPDILVFSALVPKTLGAKVILDQHDPMPELMKTIFNFEDNSFSVRTIRFLEKCSLAFADLVITVNVACKRIFAERSCRAEKVVVVMNSPDGDIFPYRSARSYSSFEVPSRKTFVVMYHGSIVERNGLDLAVDAVARLRETVPNLELKICGQGTPFLERVLQRARELGINGAIRYLGPKRLEELVGEIETCDVGIVPNQRNAFTDINTPTRIFEYLAIGKPVIAPRTPGIQDYFDGDSLLFFEPGNVEDLAKRIEYVYSDMSKAIDIAEKGQRVYFAHRWSQEKENLVNVVAGLLA